MAPKHGEEEAVFKAALKLRDPAERVAYLDRVCGGNRELRAAVEALLRADGQAGEFMKEPAAGKRVTLDVGPLTEKPGTVIGGYKLLQQIGEGGMGVVYMAEQTKPVERRVALKIIKPGMDTRQVIARFEAERQALAMMDHPNIAKVLDAGTTGSGRPYFVMELVKGIPITEYCDEHHLTPRQRLELFVPVCQAVQHAHQKGIIHRDIKPGNVMIVEYDDRAVPKIIDFGVAKAIERRLTEKTMFTQLGQMVGTMDYMSPEQAKLNQLDIDTRSDIYSLGVLLYELLTGETPFDRKRLHSAAFDELLRIIREEEPPKPSLRLSTSQSLPLTAANRQIEPKKLSMLVRGDLDWIVMKALEKDRRRRYETANGFARDIQRYLDDEPVVACPPSAGYRFKKFARRNRAALTAAALIAGALLLGTAISTWQAVRATKAVVSEQQAHRAAVQAQKNAEVSLAEARKAEAMFFTMVMENELLRRDLLTPALELASLLEDAKYLRRLIDKYPKETRLRATLAARLHSIGLMQMRLQKDDEAEHSLKEALELSPALIDEQPDGAQFAAEAAATRVVQGDLHWKMGRLSEARSAWQQSCSLLEKVASWDSNTEKTQERLARTQMAVCRRFAEIGLWQEASAYPRTNAKHKRTINAVWDSHYAVTLLRAGPDAMHREFCRVYAARWKHVDPAHVAWMNCMRADAVLIEEELLDLARRGKERTGPFKWPVFAYALTCYRTGRFEEALEEMRRAGYSGDWHSFPRQNAALGVVYIHALAHHALNHEAEARQHFDEGEVLYRQFLLNCLDTDGLTLAPPYHKCWWELALGQILRAEAWREIRGAQGAPDPWGHLLQARAYAKLGDTKKAELQFQAAVDGDPKDPQIWITRARLFAKLGDSKRARLDWRKCIELAGEEDLPAGLLDRNTVYDWFYLAMAHGQMDHQAQARTCFDKAVWTKSNDPWDEEHRRVCAEASQLLGVADPFQLIASAARQPLALPEPPTGKLTFVDLDPVANQRLDEVMFKGMPDNHLGELPQGRQTSAGVDFKIGETLIQLTNSKQLPTSLKCARDIQVGRKVARLYVLHGTQRPKMLSEETEIAFYIVHYEGGAALIIPIVLGKDVRNWWNLDDSKPVSRAVVGWQGSNPLSKLTNTKLRLYVGMWKNPHPDKQVTHIDYVLARAPAGNPFCVAMTVEEPAASAQTKGQTAEPATPATQADPTKADQKKPAPKDRE